MYCNNMLNFYLAVSHYWWWQCATSLPLLEWKPFAIRSTLIAGMGTDTWTCSYSITLV